jgi:glutathione S-transferase
VFLAEKGLAVETVEVNVREGRQFAEPFNNMNPFHCVPFLELDDGTVVAESLSICRYLQELNPEPTLFGATPTARAFIDMWSRRFELDGRNHAPMFAGRVVPGTRTDLPQLPTLAERGKQMMEIFLGRIEPHFGWNAFAVGDMFSIADITGYLPLDTGGQARPRRLAQYRALVRRRFGAPRLPSRVIEEKRLEQACLRCHRRRARIRDRCRDRSAVRRRLQGRNDRAQRRERSGTGGEFAGRPGLSVRRR